MAAKKKAKSARRTIKKTTTRRRTTTVRRATGKGNLRNIQASQRVQPQGTGDIQSQAEGEV